MKHANIAIFVPHAGCPQQCSFCDQRHISGRQSPPTPLEARNIVEQAAKSLSESAKPAQIAFFGGSFTAMDKAYMASLLESVQEYLDGVNFSGIRISTRPDSIDKGVLNILKKYGVADIELGAQSMSDTVLQANFRGHTEADTINAACQIKEMGFGLGLQMMTGLYRDNTHSTLHTAHRITELTPDYVRIYPTVVLRHTMLEKLFKSGEYKPQTLEEAVAECAELLEFFTGKNIPVIRLGLHDSPDLAGNIVAGPYHPAFRELCENRVMMRKTRCEIKEKQIPPGKISIMVSPAGVSKMIGQNRSNISELKRAGYDAKVVPDAGIGYLQVKVFQRM